MKAKKNFIAVFASTRKAGQCSTLLKIYELRYDHSRFLKIFSWKHWGVAKR
jgi:hypothetical protein